MKNKNSIFQLIDKLKSIDVNDVIEKSKNINIEDIKSISWDDIKSSKFTKPLTGIGLSIIFIFIFLSPEFKRYSKTKIISQEYSIKNRNLQNLNETLKKSQLINSILESNLKEFTDLTVDRSKIIKLTDLIYDAAKRSLIEISEFSPINQDVLASCAAAADDSNNEYEEMGFDSGNGFDDFSDGNNDDFMLEDYENPDFNILEDLYKKLDYINNNNNFLISFFQESNNTEIPKSLDDKFESNYFKIDILGDYINILNFLRAIQEYKILILPECFEPSLLSQSNIQNSSQNISPPGFVRARLMINVPTTN